MEFFFFVTIHAHHALLVMDVGIAAILAGKFRINPAAVTQGACFALIFFNKRVPLDEAKINAADNRTFYMAIAAGSVAVVAGLFKNLRIEGFQFCLGKSCLQAFPLAVGCKVERLIIGAGNRLMTLPAYFQIIGRTFDKPVMGAFLFHH